MEMILLKDVEKVGRKGEVVRVRDGFGRNFLIARGLALQSTEQNEKFVEEQKKRASLRREKEKTAAEQTAAKIKKLKLSVEAKAGEGDKLFGSVTAEDISEALAKQGFQFDKKQIHLDEPIRSLGSHTFALEIFSQVKVQASVEVIRKA
ncbi:MAG: 50S ribosomal protein L9 [Candidatus Omnitrophica bacterium]|nr:50S ribosomal protein L9 [Candidatus Omnitrophota bacterium]